MYKVSHPPFVSGPLIFPLEAASRSRRMTSQAMYAMLKRKDLVRDEDRDIQRNTQTQKTALTKDEKAAVFAANTDVQAADAEMSTRWTAWRAFYNDEKQAPNMRKQQAVIKSGLRPEFNVDNQEVRMYVLWVNSQSHTSLYTQIKDSIAASLSALIEASKACSAARAKALRPVKKQKDKENRKQHPTGISVSRRDEAIDAVEATSSVMKDVTSLIHGTFVPLDPS